MKNFVVGFFLFPLIPILVVVFAMWVLGDMVFLFFEYLNNRGTASKGDDNGMG